MSLLGRGVSRRQWFNLLSPPSPPPPPVNDAYIPLPGGKRQSQYSGRLGPCGIQTCRTWGTGGKVGYPPPGSQFFTAHDGAQSKPRGWTGLTPHTGTPLPGTGSATFVSGRRPGKSGPPQEGGGCPPLV